MKAYECLITHYRTLSDHICASTPHPKTFYCTLTPSRDRDQHIVRAYRKRTKMKFAHSGGGGGQSAPSFAHRFTNCTVTSRQTPSKQEANHTGLHQSGDNHHGSLHQDRAPTQARLTCNKVPWMWFCCTWGPGPTGRSSSRAPMVDGIWVTETKGTRALAAIWRVRYTAERPHLEDRGERVRVKTHC